MTNVIVTVKYPSKQQVDLMLPDNVPCQFLVEALYKSLKVSATVKPPLALMIESNNHEGQVIPSENTLAEMGILCGSYLELVADTNRVKNEAFLISEQGNKYILQSTNVIGRNDYTEQIHVDIDLTQLCKQRVVSRQHAVIRMENGQYTLEDHSKRGTWVNGDRVETLTPLHHGDIIDFGQRGLGATLTFMSSAETIVQKISSVNPPVFEAHPSIPAPEILEPSLVAASGQVFTIPRCPFTIGRPDKRQTPDLDLSPLEAVPGQPISSRNHSTIIERNGWYELYAHDTANGTFINGQELAPRDYKQLEDHDKIEFGYGGVQLIFRLPKK